MLALLAYERPADSPLAHLLHPQQREAVADAVNAGILAAVAPETARPATGSAALLSSRVACVELWTARPTASSGRQGPLRCHLGEGAPSVTCRGRRTER